MKKFLMTTAFGLVGGIVVAGQAMAFDYNNHVYQAANGVGDALIFPTYMAGGTIKTNLRVINTSSEYAVVAKVVFREAYSSCETRDFFIYLSPNDVWTADVVDKNGTIYIESSDDSSPVVPMSVAMGTSCNGYPSDFGYVEVYSAYAFSNFGASDVSGDCGTPVYYSTPVSKADINKLYNKSTQLSTSTYTTAPSTVSYADSTSDNYDYACAYSTQPVLAGVEEVYDASGLTLPMVATALANNDNARKLVVSGETRWDTYGTNSAWETRSALAKEYVHIPFRADSNNSTFVLFNWPAKMSCCMSNTAACDFDIDASVLGDSITQDAESSCGPSTTDCLRRTEYRTAFGVNTYDLTENTVTTTQLYSPVTTTSTYFDVEVFLGDMKNIGGSDVTTGYAEGWTRVTLTDAAYLRTGPTMCLDTIHTPEIAALCSSLLTSGDVSYNGSAVIPTYVQFGHNVLSWVPATYTCANVAYDATTSTSTTSTNCTPTTITADVTFNHCSYQTISPDMMPDDATGGAGTVDYGTAN